MTTKAYKVGFPNKEGKLQSYVYDMLPESFQCVYTPGEWTEAPAGGLFVFDTLEAALEFSRCSVTQIWECECEEPLPVVKCWRDAPFPMTGAMLESFWQENSSLPASKAPSGTLLFKRVKLTKLVMTRSKHS